MATSDNLVFEVERQIARHCRLGISDARGTDVPDSIDELTCLSLLKLSNAGLIALPESPGNLLNESY